VRDDEGRDDGPGNRAVSAADRPRCFRALILCNGDPPSPELLLREAAGADLFLCTDGAYAVAARLGVRPDVVVGDMDSGAADVSGVEVIDAGPHEQQNDSDSEKALRHAVQWGRDRGDGARMEIHLLGASGSRPDHTLANLMLCGAYAQHAEIVLVSDHWEARVMAGSHELAVPVGRTVSVVPLGPEALLRAEGLAWPLPEPLRWGTRGLSNRVVRSPVRVHITAGAVALFVLDDAALEHGEA
jgi:thiamine pyrophosphokinase